MKDPGLDGFSSFADILTSAGMVNVFHVPIFYYSVPVVAVLSMNTTDAGDHLSMHVSNFDKDTNLKSYQQHNLNIPAP